MLLRMEHGLWGSTFTLPPVSACTLQWFWIIKCKLLLQKLKNFPFSVAQHKHYSFFFFL